jgi:hypothetical protein
MGLGDEATISRLSSLEDLEADLVEVMELAVSEVCLFEAGGVPLLLTSELVDCWLSLRGRIKPREYSKKGNTCVCACDKLVLTSSGRHHQLQQTIHASPYDVMHAVCMYMYLLSAIVCTLLLAPESS